MHCQIVGVTLNRRCYQICIYYIYFFSWHKVEMKSLFINHLNQKSIFSLFELICFLLEWKHLRRNQFTKQKRTTLSNGYLGSRNDEERSEMRYVMRIAESSESSSFWTHIALLGNLVACLLEYLINQLI